MKDMDDIPALMADMGHRATVAAAELASASAGRKRDALLAAAEAVAAQSADILAANAADLADAAEKDLAPAMTDRLALDEGRLRGVVESLRAVAAQPDPVGEVMAEWDMPSGLHIRRVRTPLGVIGVIYESRPNVTADAGALAVKSGNVVILRAGSESFHTSRCLHACLTHGLRTAGLPEDAVQLVPTRDRAAVQEMLTMRGTIDVVVPRGGKGLVELVQREARVPVFAHLEGICHTYLDRAADPEMARRVILNAKTRRTGICGALECLLIHREVAHTLGAQVLRDLIAAGVEVRADPELQQVAGTVPAGEGDWGREYLDMILAARVVAGTDEAIAHIRRYGSGHTEAILTGDDATAARFAAGLDSAIVMRNASTQFADGAEFGMGAEIGIATGKVHARGPVGARELTSFKYLVEGDGAVRL